MKLRSKALGISAVLIMIVAISSYMIMSAADRTSEDSEIVNALGRQRMLSQAMAKSALVYQQKGEFASIKESVHLLDDYISQMRAIYTKTVAGPAQKEGISLSMEAAKEGHITFPYPATFTRMVNEKFVEANDLAGRSMRLDVISDNPINSDKGLKSVMDAEANEFLKRNPEKMFSGTEERPGGLYLVFYTPDKASVEACASCHMAMKGGSLKVGDVLGLRKFEILFSKDAAMGKAQLNPTLAEYETAARVFTETLAAMKSGGSYPADLAMKGYLKTRGIPEKDAQEVMERIERQLAVVKGIAQKLITSEDEKEIQTAQVSIGDASNDLRALSDDLVVIFAKIASSNQRTIMRSAWAAAILITLASVAFTAFVWISILRPIENACLALRDIAEGEGDLTRRLPEARRDEIGELAHWFNTFVANLSGMIRDISKSSRALAISSGEMSDVSSVLAANSEQMNAQTNAVASSTEQMSMNISTVASAVEEMSVNVSSVSTGAEEMSASMRGVTGSVDGLTASINKINDNAKEASDVARQVLERSKMAESAMQTLGKAAGEIGKVTEVIKRIAEQTNLLALNATIEAASAGAAGKGFAVVANEIKQLASQSASAAEDISRRIEGVQGNTDNAVRVIREVLSTISLINESVDLITSSVDTQNKAAMEISGSVSQAAAGADNIAASIAEVAKGANEVSRNTGEAAKGANEVSSNIHGVSQAARETSKGAQKVNVTSSDVSRIAGELEKLVSRFRIS